MSLEEYVALGMQHPMMLWIIIFSFVSIWIFLQALKTLFMGFDNQIKTQDTQEENDKQQSEEQHRRSMQ